MFFVEIVADGLLPFRGISSLLDDYFSLLFFFFFRYFYPLPVLPHDCRILRNEILSFKAKVIRISISDNDR